MEYKISDICSDLSIGKSTIYKRIEVLKKDIPEENWKNNEYFYYNKSNKLFITEKGFQYIKNFNFSKNENKKNIENSSIIFYQKNLVEIYKERIEYLENENKRLLDIIALKEQRDLAKDVKKLEQPNNKSLFIKFLEKFKKTDDL